MKQKALNTKEVKQLMQLIKNNWGAELKLDYVFLRSDKDKLHIMNKDIKNIDISRLKVNSMGLYIGEFKNNQLRLTIEGSQLIGPLSTKNVVDISKDQLKEWLKGNEIESKNGNGFVIVRHENDYFGCGKAKEGKILNYVPKARRLDMIETSEIEE